MFSFLDISSFVTVIPHDYQHTYSFSGVQFANNSEQLLRKFKQTLTLQHEREEAHTDP